MTHLCDEILSDTWACDAPATHFYGSADVRRAMRARCSFHTLGVADEISQDEYEQRLVARPESRPVVLRCNFCGTELFRSDERSLRSERGTSELLMRQAVRKHGHGTDVRLYVASVEVARSDRQEIERQRIARAAAKIQGLAMAESEMAFAARLGLERLAAVVSGIGG